MAQGTIEAVQKLIVIGGSAGSLEVLLHLLPELSTNLSIPIVIVVHRKHSNDATLTKLLAAKTTLPVKEVEEKDSIKAGYIYVVPGDYHALFEKDHTFSLDDSERVNYSRPSIDVVFQSAADIFEGKLVTILLSGANADGTEGMKYVQEKGGITIAQLPSTAEVPYMPEQAILNNAAHYVLDIRQITDFINAL